MTLWNGLELPESYFHDDNVYIIHGDSAEMLSNFPEKCVDLTVTSPPYDNLRNYNGYLFNFEQIAIELYQTHKDGGVVVWIVGDATVKGSETGTSFRQALYFKEVGFNLTDTMIYEVAGTGAKGNNKLYWQAFEFMFLFSKGSPKTINLINDRVNKTVGGISKGRGTDANNNSRPTIVTTPKVGRRTNIWRYMAGFNFSGNTGHPASFPEALAQDHILSWSKDNDIVLDPFLGSGTTMKMAVKNNRKCIGIEISEEYCELATIRYLRSLNEQ